MGRLDGDAARMGIFGRERPRVLFDRLVGLGGVPHSARAVSELIDSMGGLNEAAIAAEEARSRDWPPV